MNLSPRLQKIIDLLASPTKVADIGTDHAYIPIYLAQNSKSEVLIASDINQMPCQAAYEHIKEAELADQIEVRQGAGLSTLEVGEVEQAIIAGMGSRTIIDILKADYKLAQKLDKIILQPMAGAGLLRRWLYHNNFKIIEEGLVKEEEHLYQFIVARPGEMEGLDPLVVELGPQLITSNDELLLEYLNIIKNKWLRIISDISKSDPEHQKVKELSRKVYKLNELKSKL